MSFAFTIEPLIFSGRKGRKLLVPVRITISGAPPPSFTGDCALRLSLATAAGPFFIQPVPGLWNSVDARTVEAAQHFSAATPPPFMAFAAFFYAADLGPPATLFSDVYTLKVIDTVTGEAVGTSFALSITAEPALNKDVVFVLDRSASMRAASGSVTRFQRVQEAVTRGLGLFTEADNIGLVTLDNGEGKAPPVIPAPLVPYGSGAATISAAVTACGGLRVDTSLATNKAYQVGIDLGHSLSASATVVLVTDGLGSLGKPPVIPSAPQTLPTSTLFIGSSSPIPPLALTNLCSGHGSYAIAAQGTGEFAIEKLLSQILIDLGGGAIVSDPDGSLSPGQSLSFPLSINETDHELELVVFSDDAESLQVELHGPGLKEERAKQAHEEYGCHPAQEGPKGVLVKRIALAKLRPLQGSGYRVVVSRSERGTETNSPAKFTFLAAVQSDLLFDAYATASGLEVGAELLLSARLTEYGLTVENRQHVSVTAEVRHPDGGVERLTLHECSPGRFEASRRTMRAGIYTVHFVAIGRTLLKRQPFRREFLRTVALCEPGAARSCCHPHAAQ